ncbi:MAG TPA: type II secretion system protein, partial [Candidatus Pacearchaeota archaeon]|nr:type II secretion system protein [Candidatus Pacearchaeota archaeon]HOK94411.1 type II secretion system protein [Candidatus Pacearchaeota archaeon]
MEHIKHCNPQVASAKRANNSFTLIELLIVIAIIA